MKNKAELKSWFEDDKLYVGEYVKHKINQLDEPEGLSWEEEQTPETVADVIADFFKSLERLKEVLGTEVKELEE